MSDDAQPNPAARHRFDPGNPDREHSLQALADAVPTHLIYIGRDERVVVANRSMAEAWNIPIEQIRGKTIQEIVGDNTRGALHLNTERALAGEEVRYEYSFPFPDGSIRHYLNHYVPDFGPDGTVIGFVVSGIDITERRKIERELVFNQHSLKAIFEASPAALAFWRGPEQIFELVNPGFKKLFGGVELEGKRFLEALPEFADQEFPRLIRRVYETGEPYHGHEFLARHRRSPDGPIEERYYDFVYSRILDPDGNPYGVYDHAVDVTDRVVARRELETAVKDLVRERELREHFVATLSHDLRTPLAAAKMSAQIIERDSTLSLLSRRLIHRITGNLERMDTMIRDLLDANRINAGETIAIEREDCDVTLLIQSVAEEMISIHGDRFVLEAPAGIRGRLSCDGFRRILENLCNNAIKYGEAGSPVTIRAEAGADLLRISVHNRGNPIPEAEQASLFDPHRRARSAREGPVRGWGLGLTLVRGLAEAHGGNVRVRSTPETGTTFIVELQVPGRAPT